jgi:serine/threonine protein kinase
MGQAFKARLIDQTRPSPTVVIKTIQPGLARSSKLSRMFIEEAHLVARLEHPNIVRVFDLGQTDEGELFMALEHVDGVDLRHLLEYASRHRIEAPIWFYLHVVSEVLGGLAHAHSMVDEHGQPAPIIHRDVTPSNILLSAEGEIKLSDFGIAVRAEQTSSGSKDLTGKVAYMAPELLEGQPQDARADVFAVGVVLWECLALRPLFAAGTDFDSMLAITRGPRTPPSRLNTRVSAELDQIVLTALEPEPSRRFASAAQLRARLVQVLLGERPDFSLEEVRHVANVLMGREHPTRSFAVGDALASEPPPAKAPSTPAARRFDIPASSTLRIAPAVLSDLVLSSVRATLPPVPARASRGPCISVRQGDGRTICPLAPLDALTYLASQDVVAVSADGQTWLDRETAVRCAGAADLLASSHPLDVQLAGDLGPVSVLSIIASIGLQAMTGRLRLDTQEAGSFEIDVVDGRPTFVRTEEPNLRTYLVLTRCGLLPAAEIDAMLEACWTSASPLEARVAEARGILAPQLRSLILKQELACALAAEHGRYSFDAGATPRRLEVGSDELAPLLLGAIELGLSVEELQRRLAPSLAARLEATAALPTVLAQLPLGKATLAALTGLFTRAPSNLMLGEIPAAELHRFLSALYLVREIGLVQVS